MAQKTRIETTIAATQSGSRENKLAALRKAISEGRYRINSDKIAEKLIKEVLIEDALSRIVCRRMS